MTKYTDLVQICLPTHNGESHLAEALESLLSQTHRNIEIVIMDNASTDGTSGIARAYARKDSRIRYYRSEEFVCATENWNRAFERTDPQRSEFFMWASDDDIWTEDYIAKLIHPLKTNTALVLSYSQFNQIDQENKVVGVGGYRFTFPVGCAFNRVRSLIVTGQYSAIYGIIRLPSVTWRPCLADVSFGSDLWFMIQLCAVGPFEIIREPLFFKRVGGISTTNEDASASRDPTKVWNIEKKDWVVISSLNYSFLTKLYIYNRLKVSAKILYPNKNIKPILHLWVYAVILGSNHRALGIRSRVKNWIKLHES